MKIYTGYNFTVQKIVYVAPLSTSYVLIECFITRSSFFQLFLLASYCGFLTALHNLVYAFIGANPGHWCELPEVTGYTKDQLKEAFIPL
jgi:hypothetical protein